MGTCWGKNAAAAGEGAGSKQAAGSSTTGFRKLGPGPDSARGPADSDHGIGSPDSHRDRRGSSVDMLVGGGKGVRQQQQQQDGAQVVHDEDGDAEGGGHRPSQHSGGMHTPAKSASWASSASKHHQHPAGHERLISSPPLHDGPYNDGDDDERYRKMTYLKRGIVKFNGNAKQGIEYLISHGLLERDPQSIASFLHSAGTSVVPADANVSSGGAANAYLSPVPAGNNSKGRGVVMKSPAPPSGRKPNGTALSSAADNADVAQATGADGVKSLLHNALSPQLQQHWQDQPLNRVRIGEYLGSIGGKDDASRRFQRQLLEEYVALFSFEAQSLVAALRAFLSSFRLPGEAQVIDRIMSSFSSAYHRDNPNTFRTSDAAYVLSFGAIMLNTDLHKREVKRKMTLEQFCANMRGIDGGLDVDLAVLISIYQDIATVPLASDVDCDVVTFFAPARQSWLLKRCSGGITRWKKRYFLLTDGCLYYFLSPQDVSAARPRCILPLENAAVEAVGSTGLRIVPLPPSYSTAPTMSVPSSATAAEQQIPNWTNSPMKQLHADLAGSNGSPSPMLLKQQRQQSRNVALSLKSAKRNNDGQLTRGTHRDFQLRASNPADRDAWLSALSAHTQNGSADRIRRMSTVKSATIAMVATSAANAAGLQSPAGVHDKGQLLQTSSFGDLRTSAVDVSAVRNGGDDDAGLHLINGAASGAFDTDEQHLHHHHPLGIDAPVAADEDRIALGPRHQRTNGSRVDESETGLLVAPSNSSSNNNNISGSNKALGIVSSSSASNLMISAAGSSGASAASGIGRAAAGAALSAGSQGIVAPQTATSAASSGAAAGHTPRLTPRLHSAALRAPPTPPASLPLQLMGSQPQQQQSSASGAASGAGSGSTSYPHRSTPLLAPPPPGPSRESSTASAAGNFIGGGGVAGALAAPMLSLSLSSLVPSQGTAAGSAAPLISPLALPTVSGLNSSSYNDNGVSSGGGGAGAMPVPPSSQSASAPPLPLSSSAASSFSLSQLNASAASGSGVQIGDDAHAQLLHLAVAAMSTINGGTASSIPVAAAVNGSNGSGSAFVARAAAGGVATGSSTISAASTPSLRPLRAPTNISATATAANTAAAVSTSMDDIIIGRANTEDEFETSTLLDTASDLSSIDDDDSIHFGHMDQLQTTHEEAFDEDDDDEHQRQQLDQDDADGDAAGRQSQGAPRGAGLDGDDISLANASAASAMQHGSASGASKPTQSKQVVWTTGRAGSQSSSPAVDELAGPAAARSTAVSMKASATSVNSSINSSASSSLNAIAGQISRATAATAARFRILGGGARAHAGGFERTRTHDVDEATNASGSNQRHRHHHADGQLSNAGSGDDDDDDAGIGRWRARVTSEESEDDKVLHHGNERGSTSAAPGLASNPTATLGSSGSSSAAPPPIPPPPRHRDLQVEQRQILAPFGRRNQARRHSDDLRQRQQDNDNGGGEMLETGLGYIRGGNSSSETSTALQAPASAASNSSINSAMSSGAAHHLAHTRTASISPPASYAHALQSSAPGTGGDRGGRVQADAAPALDSPAPRLSNSHSTAVPAATVVVRRGAGTPGRLLPPQPHPSQRQQSGQSAASSSSLSPRILAIGGSLVEHHHHQQQNRQHHYHGAHRTDDGTSTSAVASRRPREGSDAQLLTTATGSSSSSDFAPLSAVLTSEVFDASAPSATTRSLRGPAAGAAAESLHPPFPMPAAAASASTATGVAPAIPVPAILLNRNISTGSAIDTVEVSLALDGGMSDGADHADS